MTNSRMPESRKATMICSSIGLRQISTMGLGRDTVNSFIRVPLPAAKITAFIGSQIHLLQTLRLRPSGHGGVSLESRYSRFLLQSPRKCHRPAPSFWQEDFL